MSPLGGVGGGTNPAGEEELDDVIDNLRKITRLQEPGYGLLAGEIAAAAIAADMLRDLRAVVEGLRTQLAERVRDVEDLTADRDSWSDQASRVLADWDSMRRSRDALQVRVDAVKALRDEAMLHLHYPPDTPTGPWVSCIELDRALEGLG